MVIRSSIACRPIKLVGSHISVSLFSSTLIFPLASSLVCRWRVSVIWLRAGHMHGLSWCAHARLLIRTRKPTKTQTAEQEGTEPRSHVHCYGNSGGSHSCVTPVLGTAQSCGYATVLRFHHPSPNYGDLNCTLEPLSREIIQMVSNS